MRQIEIRPCQTIDEMDECVRLQGEVWGFETTDIIPRRMFVVASKIGGQVFGAFDGTLLAGFAMAIPGIRNGVGYLHSHMLAVREGYRDAGIGRRLKLAQREEAIDRGISLMEWTFDPLELKNAHFNLVRLGAIVRRYTRSFYGLTSSALQGGLPSDRLHAEWHLHTPRTIASIADCQPRLNISREVVVPVAVSEWKQDPATRGQAREVQSRVADELEAAFESNLAIVGFHLDGDGAGVYELGEASQLAN